MPDLPITPPPLTPEAEAAALSSFHQQKLASLERNPYAHAAYLARHQRAIYPNIESLHPLRGRK